MFLFPPPESARPTGGGSRGGEKNHRIGELQPKGKKERGRNDFYYEASEARAPIASAI